MTLLPLSFLASLFASVETEAVAPTASSSNCDAITARVIDPASLCADAQRGGLRRIAATLDAVPFVTIAIWRTSTTRCAAG
jgi:hypothetical protein